MYAYQFKFTNTGAYSVHYIDRSYTRSCDNNHYVEEKFETG